jgi:hypothetical protein
MTRLLTRLIEILDYLGGTSAKPPAWLGRGLPGWVWGLWWSLLLGLIVLFSGQTSKFIYIDF